MAKKNFLLLSLEDSKIKKISNVISNESCRKILDYLSNKEATESEIAEKLNIPISTVHYNLQQLMETGLINAEEFHYSQKGKEVSHYKLANKYIIIAPKTTFGIKEKLKNILPVALIASGAALVIQLVSKYLSKAALTSSPELMAAKTAIAESGADAASLSLSQAAPVQAASAIWQNTALWFLGGALFALIVYLIVSTFGKDAH